MALFGNFFKRDKLPEEPFLNPITTDLHSHLIPNLDDGVESLSESILVLKELSALGYKKVITTPHIMGDFYKNGRDNILPALDLVRNELKLQHILIEIEASAEYMVDELLEVKINTNDLLPFGKNYILIELPFSAEPPNLKKVLFDLQINGYQPVLAHPERYMYMANNPDTYHELADSGILLQLNTMSLIGYYSPEVKKNAEYLIDQKLVHLVGSDIHGPRHLPYLTKALQSNYYRKICALPLMNNQL